MPVQLSPQDFKRLSTLLSKLALDFAGGVENFYRDLVRNTTMPEAWKRQRAGGWSGDSTFNARELVHWAQGRGTNPADQRWTTLGSLLYKLLQYEEVGLDDASVFMALIEVYNLCVDGATREALRQRYGVPYAVAATESGDADEGPEIDWRGPTDRLELQAFIKPEPPLFEVDFLARGIERAASVCRIEIPAVRDATGFLIGRGLVLTNHHVMRFEAGEDMDVNARNALLHFERGTGAGAGRGATFKLAADTPIVSYSEKLDYALLRVEQPISDRKRDTGGQLPVTPLASHAPQKGGGLSILQHPAGVSMKVAISSNGITGVYDDGVIQYVTNVAPGSSGAPCFDDDWNVVALHRGARARPIGRIGEGTLIDHVRKEIEAFLL